MGILYYSGVICRTNSSMSCGNNTIDQQLALLNKFPTDGVGCELMLGYPTFAHIWEHADAIKITLYVCNILMVLLALVALVLEVKFMHSYFRRSNNKQNRHQRKLIYMEAALPFILSFNALVISMAPRAFSIVQSFTSLFFAISINGFARMIFDYSGGVTGTAVLMNQQEPPIEVSYRAFPLTCCCPCLPQKKASKKSLGLLRVGVLQTVWVCLIATFLEYVILYDGSFCVKGQLQGPGLRSFIKPSLTIVDLLSTMIAMTCLSALAACTEGLDNLKPYNIKKKFTMFKLALLFFRIQPSLLTLITCPISNLRPTRPLYSPEAWLKTVNSYIQIIEFFLIATFLFVIFDGTQKHQRSLEKGKESKGLIRNVSRFVTSSTGHDIE